jgi:hypothetical protein
VSYLPVNGTAALSTIMLRSERVTFDVLQATEAQCDYCPRPATHTITADQGPGLPVFVCRSHARAAASTLAGSLG